ncbi:sortase B [Ruminiclostridium sufflavum DSM 19573]|uniref:Sortase B n=1 Tax=Ruminiclostridium sufflavum DSM 19573 TaxID=1121337 RepID=A0A318XFH2_9FIRM|nr:class B sortase [Ruminiclostridium sufflavum]PYG84308.1 sortase B [Ruminiclostridium sufflavum DSM 19573]
MDNGTKNIKKSCLHLILRILAALCAVGILSSAFILFSDRREYAKGDAAYLKISLFKESPEAQAGEGNSSVDFTLLEKINKDVVGWLASEGTEIDYPVVQGKDNDFYLSHLFTGESNKLGSIFMDYRNHKDFSDKNTIIYGHNMKNGSMFSALTKYKAQSYYDSFPTMLLYTPAGNFSVEWFAGIVTDGNYESVRLDFKDENDFKSYINSLKEKSTFEANTLVEADDRIITLCTCSYEFDNARYALFGKLIN